MLLHNQQQFQAEDKAVIHNFLYPVLETPLKWIPRSKSGASKSRPRWAAHTRIGNVWECPPGQTTPYGSEIAFIKFDCIDKKSNVR